MARRCYLIFNPTSGSFSQRKIDRISAALVLGGLEPVKLRTGSELDPTLFASRICAEEPDPFIVVAGGDGTVNGVLNGLSRGVATLAVIPLGTSNVLARELGVRGVKDAVARIIAGKTRPAPVGEMVGRGAKKLFLLMAGVGVDGAVVEGVRLGEKRRFGKGAYVLSALRLAFAWDREEMSLSLSGKRYPCHSVIVCNAAKYGGNFRLAPGGGIFAPEMQVVCIRGGRLTYVKLALLLGLGRAARSRSVTVLPARELEVAGTKPVQIDGDLFGHGPLRIRAVPDFVRLVV